MKKENVLDKTISVERLRRLLDSLGPQMRLQVNRVSNLAILTEEYCYAGFIEVRPNGEVTLLNDEAE